MVTKCVISQDQDRYHESHEETQVNLPMYIFVIVQREQVSGQIQLLIPRSL